jgi:membrane dipeptidase
MARAAASDPRLLADYPLVFDGLNCAALTPAQMTLTKRGRVSAMNLTVIRPSAKLADALVQIDQAWRTVEAMREAAAIVTSVAGIEAAHRTERIGIVLGAQNSLMFEDDLAHIGVFKRLGLRIVQPTYNDKTAFGYGAPYLSKRDRGMTTRGRDWLAAMERERLLVDLSHCGHRTTADFIAAAQRPLVCSHANAFSICPSPRNKTDEMISAIADKGGLVGAVMWSPAVSHATRPTLEDYLDHIEHLLRAGGADHVGFASDVSEGVAETKADWDAKWGRNGHYPEIVGLCGSWYEFETRHNTHYSSLTHTPRLWDGLRRRGHAARTIEKIMGGNWLRVLREVWGD